MPGVVRAQRRQRPGLAEQPGPARRRPGWLGARRAEDLDHAGRVLHPPVRAVPDRRRLRAAPWPDLPARAPRHRGRHRARLRPARRRRRVLPRCSSPTPSSRTTTARGGPVLGGVGEGWRVAMATTGSERGSHAALARPLPGHRRPAARPVPGARRRKAEIADPGLRHRVAQAWMDAEAYSLQTLQNRHQHRRGAADRSRSRASPSCGGASSTCACTSWRSSCSGPDRRGRRPVAEGLAVRPVRPHLRRHQRGPAQHRRRAGARPAPEVARCASPSPTISWPSVTPCGTCWPSSARPRSCGRRGPKLLTNGAGARASEPTVASGRPIGSGQSLAEMGVLGIAVPESSRRPRPGRARLGPAGRGGRATPRCPDRSWSRRPAWWRPLLAAHGDAGGPPRRADRRLGQSPPPSWSAMVRCPFGQWADLALAGVRRRQRRPGDSCSPTLTGRTPSTRWPRSTGRAGLADLGSDQSPDPVTTDP